MYRRLIGCLALFFFMYMATACHAEELSHWLGQSINMGRMDLSQWKWPTPSKIEKFYPLGFSADGWFVFSPGPGKDLIEYACASCPKPPCDRISLVNLNCDPRCHTDTPADGNDKCYCPLNVVARGLKKFGVAPLKIHYTAPFLPKSRATRTTWRWYSRKKPSFPS